MSGGPVSAACDQVMIGEGLRDLDRVSSTSLGSQYVAKKYAFLVRVRGKWKSFQVPP